MEEKKNLQYMKKLASSINSLYQDGLFCDFEIKIGTDSFSAHRVVLAACSEYFRTLFSNGENKRTELQLKDITADLFKQCLDFMYTGETKVTGDNVQEILQAANSIKQKELVEYCFDILKMRINLDSCFIMKQLAERFDDEKALIFANKYIVKNLAEVVEKFEYQLLNKDDVLLYISTFYGSHEVLWNAIEIWIKHDVQGRRQHLCDLAKAAKIETFPFSFLLEFLWHSELVEKSELCKTLVVETLFSESVCELDIRTTDSFYVLKQMARDYGRESSCKTLKEIDNFAAMNFESVARDNRFANLSPSDVFKYLKCCGTQTMKWDVALRWIKHDHGHRSSLFPELLQCIEIDEMPLDFIQQEVRTESLIEQFTSCKEAIMDALCFKVEEAEAALRPCTVIAILNKEEKTITGFNVVTKKWKTIIQAPQTVEQRKFSAILNIRNRLYVIAGKCLYQLKRDRWIQRPSMKHEPMIGQAQVFKNSIFVVETNRLSRYDPVRNTWDENLPTYSWKQIHSVAATNEHLYVIGERGGGMNIVAKKFEPDRNVWSEVFMPRRNMYGCACAVMEGTVYVMGGGGQLSCVGSTKVDFYRSFDNSWTRIANMRTGRRYFQALVANEKLYVVGGDNEDTNSIEMFEKDNDRWLTVGDMKRVFDPLTCLYIDSL